MNPKVLTLDIETAPLNVWAWGLWEQNVGVNQINTEWRILSIAWKWLGEEKVHFKAADVVAGEPAVYDQELLTLAHGLLDEADIVVTQNGVQFDLKKLNARFIEEGLPPYSPVRNIDTKIVASKHFGFTSNRLEWMGEHIAKQPKSGHKKFPGFELWSECLKGNAAAWREMEKYNKQDVLATEALYLKMRPWIEGHPNVATYGGESHRCPKCGGASLQRRGVSVTQTGRYPRYCCNDCGGWSRGRLADSPLAQRRGLLSN